MASTDFITLEHSEAGRVAWNACFTPNEKDDGGVQYSAKMIFPKNSPGLAKLKALASQVKNEAFGAEAKGIESPFSDGNEKYNEDPEKFAAYRDTVIVSFKSKYAPTVFGPDAKQITAMTQKDFYSGCWAVAHVNAYSWTFGKMKKGISFGFDAIQKIRDDERLGGTGGIQTAEQAGFSAAASDSPENYQQSGPSSADDWL